MFSIPVKLKNTQKMDLFIFLQDENLERMKLYDPAEVVKKLLPVEFQNLEIRNVIIGYATHEDFLKITTMCKDGTSFEALRYLTKGFKYRPDLGDSDSAYLSLLSDALLE